MGTRFESHLHRAPSCQFSTRVDENPVCQTTRIVQAPIYEAGRMYISTQFLPEQKKSVGSVWAQKKWLLNVTAQTLQH